jgi:hypothetical protein
MHADGAELNLLWLICTGKKRVYPVWKALPGCINHEYCDLLCVGATDNILLSSTIGEKFDYG